MRKAYGIQVVYVGSCEKAAMSILNYPDEFPLIGEHVHFRQGNNGIAFVIQIPNKPDWESILNHSNQTAIKSPSNIDLFVEGRSWNIINDFLEGRNSAISINTLSSVQAYISHQSTPELISLGSASLTLIESADSHPNHSTLHYALKNRIEKLIWHKIQGYQGWVIARGVDYTVISDGLIVSWYPFTA